MRLTNQIDVKGKIYTGTLITTLHHELQQHEALIIAGNAEEAREKFQSWATEEFPSRDSSKDAWKIDVILVIV